MTRPLGDTQKDILRSLRREGFWYPGCGWIWDNYSGTVKLMESLLKRGLVTKTDVPASAARAAHVRYDLTEEGKKA